MMMMVVVVVVVVDVLFQLYFDRYSSIFTPSPCPSPPGARVRNNARFEWVEIMVVSWEE